VAKNDDDKEFSYRGARRTTEDVTRRSRQTSGLYDGIIIGDVTRFKVKEGENAVRILPPSWPKSDDAKWGNSWEIQVYLHYGVGPDGGAFLCLDKMNGERCPVCEARRDAADAEERDALAPSWRALCWVVDRDNEKAGPQIWDMPATLFRDINARSIDKKSNSVILIDAPGQSGHVLDSDEDGYDLVFTREGTNLKTKYVGVEVMRDPSPLHDSEKTQNRWLDYIKELPLPAVLLFQTAEYIEKVLSGRAPKSAEAEDGGYERTSHRGRRDPSEEGDGEQTTRRTRRTAEVPEEEDRTSTRRRPGDEQRDETPEPESRTTRRRSAPVDSEAEPDADEKPARRGENGTTTRRRPSAAAPEGETNEPPPESQAARRGLEKLRERRKDPDDEIPF
jgi:hypothetical protein